MKRVLVIGYGNTLRSDDGVGVYAVREVRQKIKRPEVQFIEAAQLQPDMAEQVADSDLTIFIDAATDGLSGEINFEPVWPSQTVARESHNTDAETLLTTARRGFGRAPTALLATVSGECFGIGTTLTPEVDASMRAVTRRLVEIVEEFLAEVPVASDARRVHASAVRH